MSPPVQWACADCGAPLPAPTADALAAHRATPGACVPSTAMSAATHAAAHAAALARLGDAYAADATAALPMDPTGTLYLYSAADSRKVVYLGALEAARELDRADPDGAPHGVPVVVALVAPAPGARPTVTVPHTAADLSQILAVGASWLGQRRLHYDALCALADAHLAAGDLAGLNALTWESTP